jgi:hypothetical protein
MHKELLPFNVAKIVEYFYLDGIIKYDGFSTPQIDGTRIKKLFILLRKDIISR